MKDLTKYFIDLSKCSEEQQKHIFSLLPEEKAELHYEVTENFYFLHFNKNNIWFVGDYNYNKTELTYPEFIKLFDGGEGENNGWIKIESEADLPKETGTAYHSAWFENGKMTNYDIRKLYDLSYQFKTFDSINIYQPIIKPEPPKF